MLWGIVSQREEWALVVTKSSEYRDISVTCVKISHLWPGPGDCSRTVEFDQSWGQCSAAMLGLLFQL